MILPHPVHTPSFFKNNHRHFLFLIVCLLRYHILFIPVPIFGRAHSLLATFSPLIPIFLHETTVKQLGERRKKNQRSFSSHHNQYSVRFQLSPFITITILSQIAELARSAIFITLLRPSTFFFEIQHITK